MTEANALPPWLETPRLWLRPWRTGDIEPYTRILQDFEVMRYMGSGRLYRAKRALASSVGAWFDMESRLAIRLLNRSWRINGFGDWAVEEKATGELIGKIGLTHHPDFAADPAKVEVGWLLASSAWGKGFATEGAVVSLAYAFENVKLERVISVALIDNVRSQGVMRRIGMVPLGRTHWKGSDVVWYALDRDAWREPRQTTTTLPTTAV